MTSKDPDPRTFDTWEDAFQYPIPAVRKFEQQLRQHAEENHQKLRNLVGYVFRYGPVFLPALLTNPDAASAIETSLERPSASSTWTGRFSASR